jgi:hypothetical protein
MMRAHQIIKESPMRTTLDIDDDVLLAAKERARKEKISTGAALSQLARSGLSARPTVARLKKSPLGFAILPHRGGVVTLEHVRKIMDEEGI